MSTLLRIVLGAGIALTGCTALLGVKDIYLDEAATQGGTDGANDGRVDPNSEGGGADGGSETGTCKTDLQTDPKNCGRCGHDCLSGECKAGKCQAFQIATIIGAPLYNVAVTDQHVLVATRVTLTNQLGGLWRIPKTGGLAELYVPASFAYAQGMVVVGSTIYFVVNDLAANGADRFGGLYSCPLLGAAPCAPTMIVAAESPGGIILDQGSIYYPDYGTGKGLMKYAPGGAPPSVFRAGFGFSSNIFVDGSRAFYSVTITNSPRSAKVFEAFTDGGAQEEYAYVNTFADDGTLHGTPNALLFTAYDFSSTTGGVVRRVPRDSTVLPCDYGAEGNKRPYGLYYDLSRIFWTDQGDGADHPYLNGNIATCPLAGCCTTPDVLWQGDGEPVGITGDANALYFVTYTQGAVWKLAKP